MPRNRRPVDKEEKRAEILTAAIDLFVETGFDGTSLTRIATAAGVTPTTIYWYFADKEAVLVGALDSILSDAMARLATLTHLTSRERILWVVSELERYHRLVDTVHSRASASPQIDKWHNTFHATADHLVAHELRNVGVADADIPAMTSVVVFVVEGLLTHPQPDDVKAAIIDTLLRRTSASAA